MSAPRRATIAFRSHFERGAGGEPTPREYEIVATAGAGAMGVVYVARHVALDRVVALKVMGPEVSRDPEAVRRFIQEARASSLMRHENTVQVLDFGGDADGAYLVMEYLRGVNLADLLDAEGALAPSRAVAIAAQALAGLAAAHDLGIVHRDVKPSNVMLVPATDDDGAQTELVKVFDFGIATMGRGIATRAGEIIGTPDYMSPEQAKGLDVDARSDVYAVGVMLYAMLAGDVPFAYESPMETLMAHLGEAPRPLSERVPGLSPELEAAVMQALAKDPEARPENARAFRAALLATPEGGGRSASREVSAATLAPVPPQPEPEPLALAGGLAPARWSWGRWAVAALATASVGVGAVELAGVGFARSTDAPAPVHAFAMAAIEIVGGPRLDPSPRLPRRVVAARVVVTSAPFAAAIAEAIPAPVPGDAVVVAPAVAEPRAKRKEPRREEPIARVEVSTHAGAPIPATDEAPPTDVVKLEAPPAAPTIAAGGAAPSPVVPQEVAPIAPAAQVVPSFSARATLSGLALDGAIARSSLSRALEGQRRALEACYADAARAAGHDAGAGAPVRLEIDVDGRARVLSLGALGLPGLGACVSAVLGRVRLKDRPDTGTVVASFHLAFSPRDP